MVSLSSQGEHPHWSSRFGFLMASVGFAVGLGNIWRFPYVTGENGGAAFVLVYLICVFVIGAPIVMAEILIGRRGKSGAAGSVRRLAYTEGRSRHWTGVGYVNQAAALLIQVTYAVVCGWVLWYLYKALTFSFSEVDAATSNAVFQSVTRDTGGMIFWMLCGLNACGFILYSGLKDGIERAVTVLMPTLFVLLLGLVVFNVFAGGFGEAWAWLFTPDFSKINTSVFLAALGQAFFSVGVGMAAMMTYGSYLPKETDIASSALLIVVADTIVALLAGLVIFPAVFANGLDPASGPGLIFETLPVAFAQMPGGAIFACLFFLLLSVAGITSMVGLLESLVSWLENDFGVVRTKATIIVVAVNMALSTVSVLGYTLLSEWSLFGRPINDLADFVSNQVLLPLGGLFIAVFVGWFVRKETAEEELAMKSKVMFQVWRFVLQWPVPVGVWIIFMFGISD